MHGLLIEVDLGQNRQRVSELESDEEPVLEGRVEFVFTLAQGFRERNDPGAWRDLAGKRTVFELVVDGCLLPYRRRRGATGCR